MRTFRPLGIVTLTALLACGWTRAARGDDIPHWPSQQEEQLDALDSQLLETQQKLFAARQESDADAVEQLSKAFKECQGKRVALLRAMGQLPREN